MFRTRPGLSRRTLIRSTLLTVGGAGLTACATAPDPAPPGAGRDWQELVPVPPFPDDLNGEYLDVDGARIFYQVLGDGDPLLLMHGYPLSGAVFARTRGLLAEQYRVVVVDHRGYGRSAAAAVPSDFGPYASDALAVLAALDVGPTVVAGHGMSGPVALEMYRRAPERIRGIALLDSTAEAASPIEAALWNGVAAAAGTSGGPDIVLQYLLPNLLSGDTRVTDQPLVDYLAALAVSSSADALVGGARALAGRPGRLDVLRDLRVPALVVVGVEDTLYPVATARAMAAVIPRAELVEVPDAAQAAVLEAPSRVGAALARWADAL